MTMNCIHTSIAAQSHSLLCRGTGKHELMRSSQPPKHDDLVSSNRRNDGYDGNDPAFFSLISIVSFSKKENSRHSRHASLQDTRLHCDLSGMQFVIYCGNLLRAFKPPDRRVRI